MLAALEGADLEVASVTVARPSLDDVYLRYAGRTFGAAEAEQAETTRPGEGGAAMKALRDTRHMTVRHLMALWRQPWWIAVSLVQPVIWLLLFGALFKAVTDIPGFGSDNYIQFLAPGVVVMTAFFGAGWTGMPVIEDIDRGVIDRFLVSPVRRRSLISGRLASGALTTAIQSLIIVVLALIVGASLRQRRPRRRSC